MTVIPISRYTPRLTPPEVLENIFVQRQELAQQLVERIREAVLSAAKHHTLLTGPRGIGKTHLVSLVYHRIREVKDLQEHILIAWLSEEEWSVTSFLDLLICIFQALQEESYNTKGAQPGIPTECVESLYEMPVDAAESAGAQLLKEFIGNSSNDGEGTALPCPYASRTLLLIIENLDDLFAGLGKDGQKQLRTFLEENNCIILATAQSYFKDIKQKNSPFDSFFWHEELRELNTDEATQLLANIAKFKSNSELERFIRTQTGRDRIKAVHFLAGGNHRLYVIFSEFLTDHKSLDQLLDAFMRTLDDLTPYYQERMRFLSPQQRKIIDFLCDRRHPVPVKEIAQRCFMTHQTASGQLKKLLEMGYVRSYPEGRESFYELREVLIRFCLEVKKQRGEPIQLFVDFLRLWYTRKELQQRLKLLTPDARLEREYLLKALQAIGEDGHYPFAVMFLEELKADIPEEGFLELLGKVEQLVPIGGEVENHHIWHLQGLFLSLLERYEEALAYYDKVIELEPNDAAAWGNRGSLLDELGRYEEALASYDKVIELVPDHPTQLGIRGLVLSKLGRYEEAVASYDKSIELDPTHADVWYKRGLALAYLECYEEALASCDEAIKIDPNDASAWGNRGWVLGELERYEEALASWDKTIELDPTDKDGWYNRGWLLDELGRYNEALTSCDKAISLGDQSSLVFFHRAEALLGLNLWDEGIAALVDALDRFVSANVKDTGNTRAIVQNLFNSTNDAAIWRSRIKTLIQLYEKHHVLSALGQGLVRSIPALMSEMVSDKAAQTWLEVWRELASDRPEFQIPLRLLNAAVRYRETKGDRRVLLELPIEERHLLKPLLDISEEEK